MKENERVVCYAINDHPSYRYLVKRSVASLRKHNPEIPVRLFYFGRLRASDAAFFNKHLVKVTQREAMPPERANYMKWLSVPLCEGKTILYLDADTSVFGDLNRLFDAYKDRDFYAREELGTGRGVGAQQLGNMLVLPRVNHQAMDTLARSLGSRFLPVFNSGVMLFNGGTARRLREKKDQFLSLDDMFRLKKDLYPSNNTQIRDEVVASLVLGAMKKFTFGVISVSDSPWYCEWKARVVKDPGVVMHFWVAHAPFYLLDFEGKEALKKFPYPVKVESRYLAY